MWHFLARVVIVLVPLALVPSAAAQVAPPPAASPAPAAPAAAVPDAAAPGEYRIGPEDVLQIVVWNNETLSRTVPVRPDGQISLPLLSDVTAAGLTPMQLREVLTERLTEFIPVPEVSVIVSEVRSFKVSVMGEVLKPGRYELKSATTALDVLALAGGFNTFAARSRIVILRPNGNSMRRIPFNYNRVVASGGDDNLYLQPGDIVLVP